MEPFHKEFIDKTIKFYNSKISIGSCGNFKIVKNKKINNFGDGYLYTKEVNDEIEIPELLCNNDSVMKIDAKEIQGAYESIKLAKGRVGIVGLGLGYTAWEMAKKDEVTEVIVYEISKDVINLYINNFGENSKIKIIQGDALNAPKEKFDFFYVDIYNYELTEKVVEDYVKFNNLHHIGEYSFFGVEHFLLSTKYEEIIWVYIPENWMAMSKDIFGAIESAGLIDYYYQLDENVVSDILSKFKIVLNEE